MTQVYLIVFGGSDLRRQNAWEIYTKIKPGCQPETDPDTQIIQGTTIKLEEVKPLKHFLSLKPYQKAPRVILILEAQNLTNGAQKILSPLLEEENCLFILTASSPEVLPEGISQKCQIVSLPLEPEIRLEKEEKEVFQKKLKKLIGASWGRRLKEEEELTCREEAVDFCQKMLVVAREEMLSQIAEKGGNREIFDLIRNLTKTLKMLEANVNWRLAMENLFLEWPMVVQS